MTETEQQEFIANHVDKSNAKIFEMEYALMLKSSSNIKPLTIDAEIYEMENKVNLPLKYTRAIGNHLMPIVNSEVRVRSTCNVLIL